MARNKHPEVTERRILDVAARLFSEKGYEHTTIQDIVNGLGMSKGAIYHHFRSKEDILDRLYDLDRTDSGFFDQVTHTPGLSALEKLRLILLQDLTDPGKLRVDALTLGAHRDPYLLARTMDNIAETVPILKALLEEGRADGSMPVRSPEAAAEVLLLLLNFSFFPVISPIGEAAFSARLALLRDMTDAMGAPLFDDSLTEAAMAYYRRFYTDLPPS